jgi:hypothetical protein
MSADAAVLRTEPARLRRSPRRYHWLAILPAIGMLGGVPFVNRVHPMVFGLPLLFAWLVGWVLVTSAVMGCILVLDRSNAMDGETPDTAHASAEIG